MLQRVQTLFLLFVFAVAVAIMFLPFMVVQGEDAAHLLCLMPGCSAELMSPAVYAPMVLNGLVIILSAATIFQYKNRRLQIKLSRLLAVLNVLIVGLFFLLSYVKEGYQIIDIHYRIGAFLPALSILAAFLAAYYIQKDERLVRSADRIR